MAHAHAVLPIPPDERRGRIIEMPRKPEKQFYFETIAARPRYRLRDLPITVTTSALIHGVLLTAILVVPLLLRDVLPDPGNTVKAFFVAPVAIAPPPPPPPPPAASSRLARAVSKQAPVVQTQARFIAPIEVPEQIKPEAAMELGVEGGVPGGVEGGVPGGVVGGIVGGLSLEGPPPPQTKVVRIGGKVIAPKLLNRVAPEYPSLAAAARIGGTVIIEAHVGTDGHVISANVLRGFPLLNEAAVEAVKQWRYKPLLLNGEPTEFLLTVTVSFAITDRTS